MDNGDGEWGDASTGRGTAKTAGNCQEPGWSRGPMPPHGLGGNSPADAGTSAPRELGAGSQPVSAVSAAPSAVLGAQPQQTDAASAACAELPCAPDKQLGAGGGGSPGKYCSRLLPGDCRLPGDSLHSPTGYTVYVCAVVCVCGMAGCVCCVWCVFCGVWSIVCVLCVVCVVCTMCGMVCMVWCAWCVCSLCAACGVCTTCVVLSVWCVWYVWCVFLGVSRLRSRARALHPGRAHRQKAPPRATSAPTCPPPRTPSDQTSCISSHQPRAEN